jgi:hypothetical protein
MTRLRSLCTAVYRECRSRQLHSWSNLVLMQRELLHHRYDSVHQRQLHWQRPPNVFANCPADMRSSSMFSFNPIDERNGVADMVGLGRHSNLFNSRSFVNIPRCFIGHLRLVSQARC